MAAMTPEELHRFNAAKRMQDAADKAAGRPFDPHLRCSSDPERTPWCVRVSGGRGMSTRSGVGGGYRR